MQISGNEIQNLIRTYRHQPNQIQLLPEQNSAPGKDGLPMDNLTLSPQAREIQRFRWMVAQLPDIRTDRVEAVRADLNNGRYQVKGDLVAGQVLARMLGDRLS